MVSSHQEDSLIDILRPAPGRKVMLDPAITRSLFVGQTHRGLSSVSIFIRLVRSELKKADELQLRTDTPDV